MLKRPVKSSVKSSVKSLVKSSVKIIELISQNIHITIPELADQIGIKTRAVDKQIANLKKEGIIEGNGPDKGGYLKIIKQ
jgi:ATP-dependent DNA helicase RecG